MHGQRVLKVSDFSDMITVTTAPNAPNAEPKIKAVVTFNRRKVFEKVVAPSHRLYGCLVEISGVGRGATVYGIYNGIEHVFHSDQLCAI